LLQMLSEAHFVPPGLHARRVEYLARRQDNDGVWQALMPEDYEEEEEEMPPPELEEGEEEPEEERVERELRNEEIREMRAEREHRRANRRTPKELAPLLTGLLVAALFPQVLLRVER